MRVGAGEESPRFKTAHGAKGFFVRRPALKNHGNLFVRQNRVVQKLVSLQPKLKGWLITA